MLVNSDFGVIMGGDEGDHFSITDVEFSDSEEH